MLTIRMAGRWMSHEQFERAIDVPDVIPHLRAGGRIVFLFESSTGLPAGVGMRLLSLLNQLAALGLGGIELKFADKGGLYAYLNRNGFFDFLDGRVLTDPSRPAFSNAEFYRGQAQSLVEIAELRPGLVGSARQDAVTPLVEALGRFYPPGVESQHLRNSAFAALGELIDNVYNHSETRTSGFAILQAYRHRRPAVQIAVSDSGIGIPASIRRGLGDTVGDVRDADLIIRAFEYGLSRHGASGGRSCGLPRCAQLAAEFGSTVWVRTRSAAVALMRPDPPTDHLRAEVALPGGLLDGTHICLEFPLNK